MLEHHLGSTCARPRSKPFSSDLYLAPGATLDATGLIFLFCLSNLNGTLWIKRHENKHDDVDRDQDAAPPRSFQCLRRSAHIFSPSLSSPSVRVTASLPPRWSSTHATSADPSRGLSPFAKWSCLSVCREGYRRLRNRPLSTRAASRCW